MSESHATALPPNDLQAEQAVLGCVLRAPECLANVAATVGAKDFFRHSHRQIWSAIEDLNRNQVPPDIVTVSAWLKSRDLLERVGGSLYLVDLVDSVATTANVLHYARSIKLLSRVRQSLRLLQETQSQLTEAPSQIENLLNVTQSRLKDLTADSREPAPVSASIALGVLEEVEVRCEPENQGLLPGIPSGFLELDEITGGFCDKWLVILAGRANMGKTTFAVNILRNLMTLYKLPSLFVSLEVAKEHIVEKLLGVMSNVDHQRISRGTLSTDEWIELHRASEHMSEGAPLYVCDQMHGLETVSAIRNRLLSMRADGQPVRLLVIDHIQLLSHESEAENRVNELRHITRALKKLAVELDIPVIALSQLNRDLMKRQEKRPHLGDLRDGGSIDQDADLVLFVHRPEVYEPDSCRRGDAEIIVGKHRFGPTGLANLRFKAETGRFSSNGLMMPKFLDRKASPVVPPELTLKGSAPAPSMNAIDYQSLFDSHLTGGR